MRKAIPAYVQNIIANRQTAMGRRAYLRGAKAESDASWREVVKETREAERLRQAEMETDMRIDAHVAKIKSDIRWEAELGYGVGEVVSLSSSSSGAEWRRRVTMASPTRRLSISRTSMARPSTSKVTCSPSSGISPKWPRI